MEVEQVFIGKWEHHRGRFCIMQEHSANTPAIENVFEHCLAAIRNDRKYINDSETNRGELVIMLKAHGFKAENIFFTDKILSDY